MRTLPGFWLADDWRSRALAPMGALVAGLVSLRRTLYRQGVFQQIVLPVPVIIVGNIFIGGTGKTPLVAWLVQELIRQGRRPGILVRGYGGDAKVWPQRVTADSDPSEVGDEAVLLSKRGGCPVAAGPDRIAAARLLLAEGCDCLVGDDGLQHYRLARDLELAVVDVTRGLGNGRCFPAGPLREPASRLRQVALVLENGGSGPSGFDLVPEPLRRVEDDCEAAVGASPVGKIHAVAGIGNPGRFFAALRAQGFDVVEHAFPDHYAYTHESIDFGDFLPVVMTEKDAVKVRAFAQPHHWYQPVAARPTAPAAARLRQLLEGLWRTHERV